MKLRANKFVLFLAVLPAYRRECVAILREQLADSITFVVSDAHLDPTVKTNLPSGTYHTARMYRLFGRRAFLQSPGILLALGAGSVVVDLNPRSLSAWLVILLRRLLGRRTLVWGHIYPQAGARSKTAMLRVAMRRLSHGTISYTYLDRARAKADLPKKPVWVAANAIYRKAAMYPHPDAARTDKRDVIYVGRFVESKKVQLLIEGFAMAALHNHEICLRLVGGGSEEDRLRARVAALDLTGRVHFEGWVDSESEIRAAYKGAFCSVSPGFAGLGLTQSLGFGVPMLVAKNEQHSPEIELSASGGVTWFDSDSPASLAEAIMTAWERRSLVPDPLLAEFTRSRYSADAMAAGIIDALNATNDMGDH